MAPQARVAGHASMIGLAFPASLSGYSTTAFVPGAAPRGFGSCAADITVPVRPAALSRIAPVFASTSGSGIDDGYAPIMPMFAKK